MFRIARRSFTIGKLVSPAVCRPGYYCVPRFYSTTTSTDTETKELVLSNPNDFALASESPARFVSKKQGEGTFNFRLIGDESQSLEVILEPGQKIRGEVGSMIFMGPGVEMDTAMHGGFGSALGRSLTGESFFMSDFINKGEKPTKVKFGANYPSKVIPLNLSTHGGKLVAQKGAFLVGDADISIAMHTTVNLKTGFFGGEGFILQELSGSGQVFVKGGGSVTRMKLEEGEKIRVSPGSLIAFESTVKYDSEMMQGFKNIAFGGEGLFLATLEGPGVVWIQSLPFSKFMSEIASAASSRGGLGFGVPLGGGGGHSGGEEGAEEGAAEAPTEGAGEEGTMEDADSFSNDDSFGSATGSTEQSSSGSWIGGQWFGTSGESQETGSGGGDGDGDGGSWFGGFFDSD